MTRETVERDTPLFLAMSSNVRLFKGYSAHSYFDNQEKGLGTLPIIIILYIFPTKVKRGSTAFFFFEQVASPIAVNRSDPSADSLFAFFSDYLRISNLLKSKAGFVDCVQTYSSITVIFSITSPVNFGFWLGSRRVIALTTSMPSLT